MKHKAFTLIELIIVIIIIGILASIALPQFGGMKEKALDNEAKANLKLIQAAQKIYRMETGSYASCVVLSSGNSCINNTLKLSLPTGSNRNWDYETSGSGCAQCKRNGSDGRWWRLYINAEDPEIGVCSPGGV